LRIALFAVRSELAAAAIRINEAIDRGSWWRANDPLPAAEWAAHHAALASPSLPPEEHRLIEFAYQACDRMNHRIDGRLLRWRQNQNPMTVAITPVPDGLFAFRDGDLDALRDTRRSIDRANTAISQRVDGDPVSRG
jgi:hypothetical protein